MTHQRAVKSIAAADLTPQMAVNAIRLLARADAAGWQEISLPDLADLFRVEGRATIRKYLSKLRDAGLLDYNLGRDSAVIWFLALILTWVIVGIAGVAVLGIAIGEVLP